MQVVILGGIYQKLTSPTIKYFEQVGFFSTDLMMVVNNSKQQFSTETPKQWKTRQQKTVIYSFDCCCWPAKHTRPTATVKSIKTTKGHSECPSVTSRDNWKENISVIPWRDGVFCQGKAKGYSWEYPFAFTLTDPPRVSTDILNYDRQ